MSNEEMSFLRAVAPLFADVRVAVATLPKVPEGVATVPELHAWQTTED